MSNMYGRQVILPLTNKSGGGVIAGDVVVIDTANDDSFTTTTTGQWGKSVGIAQETIASNATGRVLVAGEAALVNVPASVTRGHYLETHTVVKQGTGNSTRRAGSFGQFKTGGTTPKAWLWGFPDNAGASGETVATSAIWTTAGKVAVATGTAAATEQWPPGHEFDYTQVSAGNVSITATTEGTANTVVTAAAVAYNGTDVVMLEFFCPFGATPAGNVNLIFALYDDTGGGAASIGRWGQITGPDAANIDRLPVRLSRRLTPSAATHTYSVRAYVDSGTGTVNNGAGGSGNYMPLFLRQTKV
jgi:hypothetical protein